MTHTDHKTFIAQLAPETRQDLQALRNFPGLLRAGVHFGLIGTAGAYIGAGLPFWGILLVPQGILIVFTFTLLHETVHDTPFANRWLNRVCGSAAALLLVLPALWFRYFHLAHHKYTNDPQRDPELAHPKPHDWSSYALYLSGLPVWLGHIKILGANLFAPTPAPWLPQRALPRIRREARLMVSFYLCVAALAAFGHSWVFWSWILPAVLGQPVLRLYLLAEHGRCPPVADMFENTRTTYTASAVRWLAWNMPYHCEHHAMPNVPFHALPRLNELTQGHLKSVSHGYTAFHRDYRRDLHERQNGEAR